MKENMFLTVGRTSLLGSLAMLALSLSLFAQSYDLPWQSLAGGGGTCSGGAYSMSGTIGQQSGGTMSGGQLTLTGGLWALAVVQTPGLSRLTIQPAGQGQATISWDPSTPGLVLQSSDSLAAPAWTTVSTGTNNSIAVPTTGAMKFYRLINP